MGSDAVIGQSAGNRRSGDRRQGERRVANNSEYSGKERRHNSDFRVADRRDRMEQDGIQA